MPLLALPRIIGSADVADIFGLDRETITIKTAAGDPVLLHGYLGKMFGRHAWNASVLLAPLFPPDHINREVARIRARVAVSGTCSLPDCTSVPTVGGICGPHVNRLIEAFLDQRHDLARTARLVAMCRWVVDRNEHIVLPDGYNGFGPHCIVAGCDNLTNTDGWDGPMCRTCAADFYYDYPFPDKDKRPCLPRDHNRNPAPKSRGGARASLTTPTSSRRNSSPTR